jgi:hypothetical protein
VKISKVLSKRIVVNADSIKRIVKRLKKFIKRPFFYEVLGKLTYEQYEVIENRGYQLVKEKVYSDKEAQIYLLPSAVNLVSLKPGKPLISIRVSSPIKPVSLCCGDILYFSFNKILITTYESQKQKNEDNCFVKYYSAISQYSCLPFKFEHTSWFKEIFSVIAAL